MTTRLVHLLPDTTPEKVVAAVEVVDSRERARKLIHRLIGARHDEAIDPALLPWLLRDWGLENAAAFVSDWQLLYREGKAWQRERGTLAAADRALSWLGHAGAELEEIMPGSPRWALLQVALPKPPERLDPIGNVVGLTRLSVGAKTVLERIHSGFDIRAIRPDFAILDGGLLDFDSGVRLRGDWPILSFGRSVADRIRADDQRPTLRFDASRLDAASARYVDALMLDWSVPDDQRSSVFRNFDTGTVDTFELESGARRDQVIETHRIIKAAIIADQQWAVESLQAVFPGCDLVPTGRPWLADGFRLDADTHWFRKIAVEAIVEAVVQSAADLRRAVAVGADAPILGGIVNGRARRGFEAEGIRLDETASFSIPELQTFSHVASHVENVVPAANLAFVAHEVFKAGIRLDDGPPVETLQAVFSGGDVRPTGRPWLADGFRLDADTHWHRSTPIREILSSRIEGAIEFPKVTAETTFRMTLGSATKIESRLADGAATLLASLESSAADYDGQSWVDLVPPEGETWESLHVIIGTSLDGDSNG